MSPPPLPPKPPPPAPETLQGIGEGIHAIQLQQSRDSRKLDELGQNVADINATVTVHGREIRQLRDAVDEHHERLVDLERLPRARSPHPSTIDTYDPDETPGGGLRVDHAIWSSIVSARTETEKALNELREQLDATERAREIEQAQREAVEADSLKFRKTAAWWGGGILGAVAIAELVLRVIWHH